MLSPEQFQEQVLPYLYDLLDDDERRAFEANLEASPEARTSLESARAKKGLLAEAVKSEFPGVIFAPPPARSTAQAAAIVAMPRRDKPPGGRRLPWVVAASILLVALGGGAYLSVAGWVEQKQRLTLASARLNTANSAVGELERRMQAEKQAAQQDILAIQGQINVLVADWNKEAALQKKAVSNQQVQLTIQSPRRLQAGGANSIQIEMKRNQNAPNGVKQDLPPLNARVIDQTNNQLLFAKAFDTTNGQATFNFDLPRDLPVKPGMNLALEVVTTSAGPAPLEVREQLTLDAPEYVTHLFTDRPMYRPGETIHFRSLTLERFSMKPAGEQLRLRFSITSPSGVELPGSKLEGTDVLAVNPNELLLKGPDGQPLRGIGAGEFAIPDGLPGGQYTLHVAEAANRFPPEKRTFIIHQWQAPRINKEITFDRSSYGPGDAVEITARGVPVEGDNLAGPLAAIMTVTVDGQQVRLEQRRLGADGRVRFPAFTLPQQITTGNGIVSIAFTDGGNRETLVRPIPIVLGKLLVDFYPEGGDLINGLVNRVYFQAHTTAGKPADLQGRIVDEAGAVFAKVQTLTDDQEPGVNQGMGLFELTPQGRHKYELKIDSPIGMHGSDGKQRYLLPLPKADGVVLRLPRGVVENTIDVIVTSAAKDRQLLVGAYCRGKLLDHINLEAKAGQATPGTLRPTLGVGGVYRITVFEKAAGQLLPLAERLVFRAVTEKLNLKVVADKTVYYPGNRVRVALEARNDKKEWSPAVLLVSVVDLSVQTLANDKTARALPTHFLLTSEVRQPEDLENADFFLGHHPKAQQALDLLLGVQGWRRFAEQDPARFKRQNRDADRIVQAAGPGGMQTNHPEQEVLAKVDARFAPKFVALQKSLAAKEVVEETNPETQKLIERQQNEVQSAVQQSGLAVSSLEAYERFVVRLVLGGLVIGALLMGLLMLYLGMRQLSRGRSAVGFFAVGAILLLVLFMGSLAGTFWLMGGHPLEERDARRWAMQKTVAPRPLPPPAPMAAPGGVVNQDDVGLQNERGAEAEFADLGFRDDKNAPALRRAAFPQAAMLAPMQDTPVDGGPIAGGGRRLRLGAEGIPNQRFGGLQGMVRNDAERQLRQQGKFNQLLRQRLNRPIYVHAGEEPFMVREYAHTHLGDPSGFGRERTRTDFTETLYWHPALVLASGKGEVSFDLSDAHTRFQILVFGHTLDGRLGATTFEIAARMPVSIEPKVPIEVTSSDTITIPVTIANDSNEPANTSLAIQLKNLNLLPNPLRPMSENVNVSLASKSRARELFAFQPAVKEGLATVRVSGDFGTLGKDAVERTFTIVPEGFPVVAAQSGLLEKSASHELMLPASWVPGTLKCQVQILPSTLAELQKGLEGLLREPCGCFEQSSSSNYPNVLILNYLKEADLSKPEVEKRARQLLGSGYAKLTSFECIDPGVASRREGYEWFGQTAPPHEALTAYGLLQFKDMAKVYPVDENMLKRTRKYLLDRRDGKGGFKRNPRSVDSFGRAPDHITNAYIVWALTESGLDEDLTRELKALYEKAKTASDPYFLALVAISHINQNKAKLGVELLKNMIKSQKDDGHLDGALTSITGSGGRDLVIETTALATLGWLKANRPEEFNTQIDKAAKWLGRQRGGYGGFGSTQSTILALKALIAHTRAHKKPIEAGEISVFVGDRAAPVAGKVFSATVQEPLTLAVPDNLLKPGPNPIRVQITGRNEFPYTLSWSYQTVQPPNAAKSTVHLTARLQKNEIIEGDTVRLTATVTNQSGKSQGMTVAIIGLPGGLALPEDFAQLKDMTALRDQGTKPGVISAWELRGRELVLYWRDLAPDARIDVNLDLVGRLPGIYRGPAPRAYLYYNADNKFWTEPLAITIRPAVE